MSASELSAEGWSAVTPRGTADWSQFVGHASRSWMRGAVDMLAQTMLPNGCVLAPMLMAESVVIPVVELDKDVVAARQAANLVPAVDRASLQALRDRGEKLAASPVASVVFIGNWGVTTLTTLSRLRGYGRTVLIVPSGVDPAPMEVAECDWRDIAIVRLGARLELEWIHLPVRTRMRSSSVSNLRFERLWASAEAMRTENPQSSCGTSDELCVVLAHRHP